MCLRLNINMVTKTITVTEDAYFSLKGLKTEGESFSDTLIRLGKSKNVARKYLGILDRNPEELRKKLKETREEISRDFEKRKNVLFR